MPFRLTTITLSKFSKISTDEDETVVIINMDDLENFML